MNNEKKVVLKLARYTFDPLVGLSDVIENLRSEGPLKEPTETRIIQFIKPLTQDQQLRIKGDYGLKLTDYIPDYAYLEKVEDETLERLSNDPLFRAEIPYLSPFKISPLLGKVIFRTEERKKIKGLWLNTVLFADADIDRILPILNDIGATDVTVVDDRKIGGSLQIRFKVASNSEVHKIAELEEVRWIEEVPERKDDNVNAAGTLQSGAGGNQTIWNRGLHGEQQVIGMIDASPLDINHCFFRQAVNNVPGPAHRKVLAIRNTSGTAVEGHATFVAGCAAGDDLNNIGTNNRRGGAWAARLVSGNRNDLGTSSVLAELVAASSTDARIHTNSWHDNTAGAGNPATYNQTAVDVDTFTWNNEDNLVLGSAGNNSEEQGPPGTAKNAICVGATQADPNEMTFGDGNNGPTADGRQKPDLMAPGCGIQSATVSTTCGTGPRSACATSYATPHTAAAAALARQYFMEGYYPTGAQQPHHSFTPSGALLKAALLNSTIDMTNIVGYPNNQEGWGLIRLDNVLYFPGSPLNLRVWDVRNADGITTGQTRIHHIDIQSNVQRLKVALVWTDSPGTASSATPMVNNLDLEVISPDGTQTFRGNVFSGGISVVGGVADTNNNVEIVLMNNPVAGDWTVRVLGTAVNVGNPGQGYALVVTGDLTEPPVTVGVQDTLVVRVKFADIAHEPPLANLQNLMAEVGKYIKEVSYNQTTVVPTFRGTLQLDHNKDYYYHPDRNLLIELTEEV
jgi:Subtilase family